MKNKEENQNGFKDLPYLLSVSIYGLSVALRHVGFFELAARFETGAEISP